MKCRLIHFKLSAREYMIGKLKSVITHLFVKNPGATASLPEKKKKLTFRNK